MTSSCCRPLHKVNAPSTVTRTKSCTSVFSISQSCMHLCDLTHKIAHCTHNRKLDALENWEKQTRWKLPLHPPLGLSLILIYEGPTTWYIQNVAHLMHLKIGSVRACTYIITKAGQILSSTHFHPSYHGSRSWFLSMSNSLVIQSLQCTHFSETRSSTLERISYRPAWCRFIFRYEAPLSCPPVTYERWYWPIYDKVRSHSAPLSSFSHRRGYDLASAKIFLPSQD